jgi:hypothetical protein
MKINVGKEWRWMDDEEIHRIKDEEWDFYSNLPNPKWYEDFQK